MKFSIVVVCLNAGDKLLETVNSIWEQDFSDYEIVVKDGGSKDGSVERLQARSLEAGLGEEKIRIVTQKDQGIYDAMNQAITYCQGEFLLFLNCGDRFATTHVLEEVSAGIKHFWEEHPEKCKGKNMGQRAPYAIFYGDIEERMTGARVASNPHMDAFACYRNVPCHQCCFYSRELFAERGYDTSYRVRADYEHFLWSFFMKKAVTVWLPVVVASYEGGGFSETAQNRKVSEKEHREITGKYMGAGQLFRFRLILLLTLAPLRTRMAQSKRLAGVYNGVKKLLYRR